MTITTQIGKFFSLVRFQRSNQPNEAKWNNIKKDEQYRDSFITDMVELMGGGGGDGNKKWNQRIGWKTRPYAHKQRLFLPRSHAFFLGRIRQHRVWRYRSPIHWTWWNKYIGQYGTNSSNKVAIYTIKHRVFFLRNGKTGILYPPSASAWLNPPTTFICSSTRVGRLLG